MAQAICRIRQYGLYLTRVRHVSNDGARLLAHYFDELDVLRFYIFKSPVKFTKDI